MNFFGLKNKKISIVKEDVFKNTLLSKMDEVMSCLWPEFYNSELAPFDPLINMQENIDNYSFEIELPIARKDDFDISFDEDYLLIKEVEKKEYGKIKYHNRLMEQSSSVFCRAIPIPLDVDRDNIKIDFRDGTLHVVMRKIIKENFQ
jgi:HSP20 family protein